jgi:hypothetical protein
MPVIWQDSLTVRERVWDFRNVVVDLVEELGRCIRQSVQIARKSVKYLLSLVEIVRFIAKNVFQSAKILRDRQ